MEYPGFDVQPGTAGLGQARASSANACLAICLGDIHGCQSAVFVTNSAAGTKTCYYKTGDIAQKTGNFPDRFVAVGCEVPPPAGAPPAENRRLNLCACMFCMHVQRAYRSMSNSSSKG